MGNEDLMGCEDLEQVKTILFDADGTLWDFDASAVYSIRKIFERRGYEYSDMVFERYNVINNGLWERYERGEMSRDRVLVERFDLLFEELGIDAEGAAFEKEFREMLELNPVWMKDAQELLSVLRPDYKMYVVTNGIASTQRKRIALTGLDQYVDGVFISEEIGAQKPMPAFFDHVLSHIEPCRKDELLLVGDSLTADILGANRSGIPSCWYNPKHLPLTGEARPDYEITRLMDLEAMLGGWF